MKKLEIINNFELDKEAHLKGECSFSSLALCSAEEQRIKMFFMDILNSLYKEVEEIIEDEKSALPADDLEKTAEWYKIQGLKQVLSLIDQYKNK